MVTFLIEFVFSGNMVIVGSVGTNMSTLLKLVCRVASLSQFKVDFSSESAFMDGLRSIVRMTGSEGRTLAVCISARDLTHDMYLHTLNSLLISGDYTTLFSTDEIEGLYQALGPQIRRDFPNEAVDPEKYFVHNVTKNLHMFFTLPPSHSLINRASRLFQFIKEAYYLIYFEEHFSCRCCNYILRPISFTTRMLIFFLLFV